MLVQEIIAHKRDRLRLPPEEVSALVAGIADGSVSEAQAAAFAMAVLLNGMSPDETVALTLAMRDSGSTLAWDLPGPVIGKHSTGGIGDKVSLVLGPVLAACGAYVPKISGRGLGHTGGTLDKLEAITGYQIRPDEARFRQVVADAGCAIVGSSEAIAPADRRLYAVRDVTATVESVPLLTSSILAKQLAVGVQGLVMDVKVGSGAFLPSLGVARELGQSLVEVAVGSGLPCRALLTDMSQCLGRTAGNALEVAEAIALLKGEPVDWRLEEVVVALAATGLVLAGADSDEERAAERVQQALASGHAAERFARMVAGLGGPSDLVDRPQALLPTAPVVQAIHAERGGVVAGIDARALGWSVVELGGGRQRTSDAVDHRVGLAEVAGHGDTIDEATPLAVVHAANEVAAAQAGDRVRRAFIIADEAPPAPELIKPPESEGATRRPGDPAPRPSPRRFGNRRRR